MQIIKTSRQAGFTLIELMVVVVILAILGAVVAPMVLERPDEARIVKAKQDIASMGTALQLYRLDNYNYPSTDEGLNSLSSGSSSGKSYLQRIPKDPWGNDYLYLQPGTHGDYDIYSFGADGLEGGSGVDADIGNWNIN